MPVDRLITVRRGTAAAWTAANPTLAAGEWGYETDTGEVKIGDGITAWASLGALSLDGHGHPIADVTGLQSALDGKQPIDADLTALAALSSTGGYAKRTATNTWAIATPSATDVGAAASSHTHGTTYHTAASMTVDRGTLAAGTVATTRTKDNTSVQVTELNGADPLRVRFAFTGITTFDGFVFFGRYDGSPAHEVHLEIYNATAAAWELVWELTPETSNRWYNFTLYNSSQYLNAGQLELRFYHVSSGAATHNMYVDYVALAQWSGVAP